MILRKYIFTGLLVVVNFLYCFSQTTIEPKPLDHYSIKDTVKFKVFKFGNLIDSSYKINALAKFNGSEYFITIDHVNDSAFSSLLGFFNHSKDSIRFDNDICPLIDYKTYINGTDTLIVYRYQWVIKKNPHDQAYIYCNPTYGLLAWNLNMIGFLFFYEKFDIPKKIESRLMDDILEDRY
jgi:hypothetical protein